jgi:hypothetical protein
MNRIYLALSVTAFAMSASPGAARADALTRCDKMKTEQKVGCIIEVLRSDYVYVGREVRLWNEKGPFNGCISANDPPGGKVLELKDCGKDLRQNWNVQKP